MWHVITGIIELHSSSRKDIKNPNWNIKIVADVSCDIDGPVASTLRPSTIENPFYGYNPK